MRHIFMAVAATVMLTACGGSQEAKFAENCGVTMEAEGMSADQATATCKCAYAKLETELDSSQLKLAAEAISATGASDIEKIAGDRERAEFMMERVQGAVKSCAM